jgi:BirA family biotin operon repressor/biotin-[acetyl-CoA-carboxylase] ligase
MPEDKLNPELIAKNLPTRFIGKNIIYYPSMTSTMDVARQQALKKAPEGTIVTTERQTSGKGRLKRSWITTEGNIAVSILLYPSRIYLHTLTILSCLAVLHSIETTTGLICQLKWPNDVLIEGKKVCGILLESQATISDVEYAVIGIGINVNMIVSDYPEIAATATSLASELGKEVSRTTLLRNVLVEMEKLYLKVQSGESLREEWKKHLITLGKDVRVRSGEDIFEGVAESVAEDGSLLLRCKDGNLMKFMAGDVTLK